MKPEVHHAGRRVRFVSGELTGRCGVIESVIPRRYRKETLTFRVRVDGFPIPGGWSGLTAVPADILELLEG